MTDCELMQQALDALEEESTYNGALKQALRARLAQPEQEPVAWVAYENGEKHGIDFDEDDIAKLPVGTMLYSAPPQREWQGLTDEEIEKLVYDIRSQTTGVVAVAHVARAIEAKLKQKNE